MESKNYGFCLDGCNITGFGVFSQISVQDLEKELLSLKKPSLSSFETIKISAKQGREFGRFLAGNNIRLPRKIKKKSKKQSEKNMKQWFSYCFPDSIDFRRGYGKTLITAYKKALRAKNKERRFNRMF